MLFYYRNKYKYRYSNTVKKIFIRETYFSIDLERLN